MSATKILVWVLCGAVGLWGLVTYVRMSLRLWLRAVRFEPPPQNIPQYLKKATIAVLAVCVASYGALVTYDWGFLSWIGAFLILTIIVVSFTTGNLWLRIRAGLKLYQIQQQSRAREGPGSGREGMNPLMANMPGAQDSANSSSHPGGH